MIEVMFGESEAGAMKVAKTGFGDENTRKTLKEFLAIKALKIYIQKNLNLS